MTAELSTYGIESDYQFEETFIVLRKEIDYLSDLVRKLEIDNYELRQEIAFMKIMMKDIEIGIPKGEMN